MTGHRTQQHAHTALNTRRVSQPITVEVSLPAVVPITDAELAAIEAFLAAELDAFLQLDDVAGYREGTRRDRV